MEADTIFGKISMATQQECAAILAAVASRLAVVGNVREIAQAEPPVDEDELLAVERVAAMSWCVYRRAVQGSRPQGPPR